MGCGKFPEFEVKDNAGGVQNCMLSDFELEFDMPPVFGEKLNGAGYKELRSGIFVPEEDAYDYAMERISQDGDLKQEFKQEFEERLVEWFYSGSWIKEE